jgi:hypothetical protein
MVELDPEAWSNLIKMVGTPILTMAYFMWKDYKYTQKIAEDLAVIKYRIGISKEVEK